MRINGLLPRNLLGPFQKGYSWVISWNTDIYLVDQLSILSCLVHTVNSSSTTPLVWHADLNRPSFILLLFQQMFLHWVLYENWHPTALVSSEFADVNYIVLSVINLIAEASDDCDLLLKGDRILWISQQWTHILIKQWIYSIFLNIVNLKVSLQKYQIVLITA